MKSNVTKMQIPKDWRVMKLGDVGTTYGGLTGKGKTDFGAGKPFVSYMDVYGSGSIRKRPTSLVKVSDGERQNNVQYGDVVFTTSSETADEVGTASVFLVKNDQLVYLNSFCFGLRVDHDVLASEYAQFFFRAASFRREMTRIAQGATRYNLSKKHFLQTGVVLPPLPEQKRIVKVLEAWDQAIDLVERKIARKREVKKGLMQRLLTGKKRLPGFSGEWKKIRLGDFGSTYAGLTGKDKNDFGKGHFFVTYMNIFSNAEVDVDNFGLVEVADGERQNKVQYGDVLFTTSSETPKEVGTASTYLSHSIQQVYLNSFCFGYRLKDFQTLIPDFAKYIFRGQQFRKEMAHVAQGASRYNLSKRHFLDTQISVPQKIEEQSEIAKILSMKEKELHLLEQKLTFLKDQKKYLLNNLVTGAIRTPEKL